MLLNQLSKEEKFYFLDLLSKVINADGPATDYDKIVFEMFKSEMGEDINRYKKSNQTTEKLIEYFSNKSKAIKNVVYYNILWTTLSDEFYTVEEHLILEEIIHEFGITNRKKAELFKACCAERDLKEKIKRLVIE